MARKADATTGKLGDETNSGGNAPSVETPIDGSGSQSAGAGGVDSVIDGGAGGSAQAPSGPANPNQEASEAPRKRRGRPPGSGSGPKPTAEPGAKAEARKALDPKTTAAQVQGIHAFIASLTQEPGFLLADPQAMMLGKAIADASEHFDFAPSGKIMSLMTLAGVAAIVYVPMFAAINAKKRQNRPMSSVMPATPEDIQPSPAGAYDFSTVQ